jgi:hypothetical protein
MDVVASVVRSLDIRAVKRRVREVTNPAGTSLYRQIAIELCDETFIVRV